MTSVILNLDKLLTSQESLSTVRSQLLASEHALGLGDLHRNAIRILRKGNARLVHSQVHASEVVAFAVSPNGRYFATGSWVGDDYERGGALAVWDIEMGRCVNVLDPIEGGVGWPEYPHCITWTADSERIGVAFNTNSVGFFDPFGETTNPLHYADVTDGWSRPPAFCVLPDGHSMFVGCWRESKVPGVLVTFKKTTSKRATKPTLKSMAKAIPAKMVKKLENGHLEPPKRITPSPDGTKLHCINAHGFAYTITLKTGELDYISKVGLPAAYSPDGRFLAHTLAGLVIYDGATGLPTTNLPMHVGMNALHWAKRDSVLRLAGVVSEDNEFNAEPGVHIYDDGVYRYSIDVKPRPPNWDDGDFAAFAWSPSGQRAAVLDGAGRLHIVKLGQEVATERTLPMDEELRGIWWAQASSREVIILANRQSLIFVDANTGETIANHRFMQAPETTRPLDTGSEDLGDRLRPDPTFALDDATWAVACPEGVVIAPADKKEKLDAHLAWVVNRRHAWPARWGEMEIVASAADVAKANVKPAGINWKKFKQPKARKQPVEFPPPNVTSLTPMYDALVEAMKPLGPGWSYHVATNLRYACRLRARRGEIAEALVMAENIPTVQESLCVKADLTAIAYRAGQGHLLDDEFQFVVEEVETEINTHNEIIYAIAMFSAWAAKKDTAQSNAWLARAKAKLEPENNPWEYRLELVWALVEAGRHDEARTLFTEKAAWQREPLCFYTEPFCVAMVREGYDALLFEFFEVWKQYRFGNIDWGSKQKTSVALAQYGRTARLLEGKDRFGLAVDDERLEFSKLREKTGMALPSPSPADIEALAHDYAAMQKVPRARRGGPRRALVQKAIDAGHVGAVLALLPDFSGTDFNDRAQIALSALWTAATGSSVAAW